MQCVTFRFEEGVSDVIDGRSPMLDIFHARLLTMGVLCADPNTTTTRMDFVNKLVNHLLSCNTNGFARYRSHAFHETNGAFTAMRTQRAR